MDEIYKQLNDIQTKIKIVRYFSSDLSMKVNKSLEWCNIHKEQLDKISINDKKELEKLSASLFKEICNAMHVLTVARVNSYDIAEFMMVE